MSGSQHEQAQDRFHFVVRLRDLIHIMRLYEYSHARRMKRCLVHLRSFGGSQLPKRSARNKQFDWAAAAADGTKTEPGLPSLRPLPLVGPSTVPVPGDLPGVGRPRPSRCCRRTSRVHPQ